MIKTKLIIIQKKNIVEQIKNFNTQIRNCIKSNFGFLNKIINVEIKKKPIY
jgi:hypothetical protein